MFTATAFSSQDIVRDGLVLWLDANDKTSYPGTGTVWRDLSLGGNNGTLTNGPTFNSGNGGSIVFDGSNDRIVTSPFNYVIGTGRFTIDVWFKSNPSQTVNGALICLANTALPTNWQLSFTSNILRFWWSADNFINSTYISNNQWTNATVVRESTSSNGLKFYINSTLNTTATVPNNFTDNVGYRLGVNRGLNAYYRGDISIARVFSKALTQQEILQNYNATKERYL
jgi:hypothetical protein